MYCHALLQCACGYHAPDTHLELPPVRREQLDGGQMDKLTLVAAVSTLRDDKLQFVNGVVRDWTSRTRPHWSVRGTLGVVATAIATTCRPT